MAESSHTIVLAGTVIYPQEKMASEAILPGHLVEFVPSGGDAGQLRKHTNASFNAAPAFAVENQTPDRSVATAAIDTPYADGETVRWCIAQPGALLYALIPAAAAAIVVGDYLESADGGMLQKHTPQAVNEGGSATVTVYGNSIVAMAAEAVDNSGGGTAVRLRCWAL